MPDYGPETRLARAPDAAIARHNREHPPTPPGPLCGVNGCPLPSGHVERAGSDHLPPILPDPAARLVPRTLRVDPDTWRRAAARAQQDGRGLAEITGALLAAYAAGELDAPPTTGTPWTRHRDTRPGNPPTQTSPTTAHAHQDRP